jgi:hypothetical protein
VEEGDVIRFPKKEIVDGGGRPNRKRESKAEAEQDAMRKASQMNLIGIGAPAKVERRK